MKKILPIIFIVYTGCKQHFSSSEVPMPHVVAISQPISINQNSSIEIDDTEGIESKILDDKSIAEFIKGQNIDFREQPDTIINDDHQIVIGETFSYKHSKFLWFEKSLSYFNVVDSEVIFNYGIHCGLIRSAVCTRLGIPQTQADTISFNVGLNSNRLDFYFMEEKLHTIYYQEMPD